MLGRFLRNMTPFHRIKDYHEEGIAGPEYQYEL